MKTLELILALCLLPFVTFSQKENEPLKKEKHKNKSFVYVKPFYGPPKLIYITKKHKAPPLWASAHDYKHRNVYFPKYKCYYDTFDGVYIYKSGQRWAKTFSPPAFLNQVDLSSAQKVELELDAAEPQVYFEQHVTQYPSMP